MRGSARARSGQGRLSEGWEGPRSRSGGRPMSATREGTPRRQRPSIAGPPFCGRRRSLLASAHEASLLRTLRLLLRRRLYDLALPLPLRLSERRLLPNLSPAWGLGSSCTSDDRDGVILDSADRQPASSAVSTRVELDREGPSGTGPRRAQWMREPSRARQLHPVQRRRRTHEGCAPAKQMPERALSQAQGGALVWPFRRRPQAPEGSPKYSHRP